MPLKTTTNHNLTGPCIGNKTGAYAAVNKQRTRKNV